MPQPWPKPERRSKPKARPRTLKNRKPLRSKGGRLFKGREDPEYLMHLRHQPCAFCLVEGRTQTDPTEVEHVVNKSQGGYDRGDTVPGCAYHREQRHGKMGTKAFAAYYRAKGFDVKVAAKRYAEHYEAETWPCP